MRTTTAPYFKFDTGQFLAETIGLPNAVVGLYARMMTLYWESGCVLPDDQTLKMRLGIKKSEEKYLELIIREFFGGETRKHSRLDLCLDEVQEQSQRQRERANKRWQGKRQSPQEPDNNDDF